MEQTRRGVHRQYFISHSLLGWAVTVVREQQTNRLFIELNSRRFRRDSMQDVVSVHVPPSRSGFIFHSLYAYTAGGISFRTGCV